MRLTDGGPGEQEKLERVKAPGYGEQECEAPPSAHAMPTVFMSLEQLRCLHKVHTRRRPQTVLDGALSSG